jgi:rare lipoprotein A (peptidoglycan hydrolase)
VKSVRVTIAAFSVLALSASAQAQGGRPGGVNPLQVLATQLSATIAAPAQGQTAAASFGDRQIIRASWYGGGERLSAHTSSGEIFRPMGRTAAHRTLPFGTMLRVSSLDTGLSTIVRINDRGPAAATGRSLDLSHGAAIELGIAGRGEAKVAIEVVH